MLIITMPIKIPPARIGRYGDTLCCVVVREIYSAGRSCLKSCSSFGCQLVRKMGSWVNKLRSVLQNIGINCSSIQDPGYKPSYTNLYSTMTTISQRHAKMPHAQSLPAYKSTTIFTAATRISAAMSTITKSLLETCCKVKGGNGEVQSSALCLAFG